MQTLKPSGIIFSLGMLALMTGCVQQQSSTTAPVTTYQWITVESDNFLTLKSSDSWTDVMSAFYGFKAVPWLWSDTSGGILTITDSTATATGHVTGTGILRVATVPGAYRLLVNFRFSSTDSNAAAVLLIDNAKNRQYSLAINRDSAGSFAPGILSAACVSTDSLHTLISETHQAVAGLTANTVYQLALTIDNSSLRGELLQTGFIVAAVTMDSSAITGSSPVNSMALSAGIDLTGTPSSPARAYNFSVQADYRMPGYTMWQWNDASILVQDTALREIRSVGHAVGALAQNGTRQSWPASSPVRITMGVKFSSTDSNAAAITLLDSAGNRRYWLIIGNNGIGQAAAGQLSAIVTDAGNSQTIISQAHQAIQNLSANTYYQLVMNLYYASGAAGDSLGCGQILQSGSLVAQTKIPGSPIASSNTQALFPGVDLIGTSSSPVYANSFQVEFFEAFTSGSGGGSCPFVYSFDGEEWVFDAEPYGGAFTRGLQRTEWCVLEHLREVHGGYALRMTNELDETQFTDELKLVIVDHDSGVAIAPDASGGIHTIENPVPPRSACDAAGTDILPLVAKKDGRSWQSPLLSGIPAATAAERDTLEFEFPKPRAAKTVKLVINASTTPFGAEMGKRFLTMHGGLLSTWYDEIDKGGAALDRVHSWYKDQELYMLKAWVQTPRGWEARETILGSGPMAEKAKVYIVNIRDIPGTILRIRLCPPAGFWSFDYLAADYSTDRKLSVYEAGAATARENDGKDAREALGVRDGSYLVSEKGSSVELSFAAPAKTRHTVRSVVLKANGWYRIHLNAKGLPRFDLLARMNEPGFGSKYAIREYLRLYKQTAMR